MPLSCWKLALLFGMMACSRGSGISRRDGATDTHPTGRDGQVTVEGKAAVRDGAEGWDGEAATCRADKIAFSQDTGCQNDGAVEFCLPASDTKAESQVRDIAPTVKCSQGSGGRAGCRPETEQLCQLPVPRERCPYGSPMPDDVWLSVCRIAALDTATRIVPTWYE